MFITVFTTVRHQSMSRGKWTQFVPSNSIFSRCNLFLLLSSHLYLGHSSCPFIPAGFTNKSLHIFSSPPLSPSHRATCHVPRATCHPSQPACFNHPYDNRCALALREVLLVQFAVSRSFPLLSKYLPHLLLSKNLNMYSYPTVGDQVPHPYKKM
jgi:hypothetical protein